MDQRNWTQEIPTAIGLCDARKTVDDNAVVFEVTGFGNGKYPNEDREFGISSEFPGHEFSYLPAGNRSA
jgi:hypothetical protein